MAKNRPFMNIVEENPPAPKEEPKPAVLSDGENLDIDPRLRDVVGEEFSLSVPRYTKVSRGSLHVSYAIIDKSYYYQIEMDSQPAISEDLVIAAIGQAFLAVVPEHIHTYIKLPPKDMGINLYTAIAKDSGKLIGAKDYMEKKLVEKILAIDFWPK